MRPILKDVFIHPIKNKKRDFPGGPVVKNSPCKAGDTDSVPGQGTNFPRALGHPAQTGQLLRLSALGPECQAREKPSDLNKRAHVLQLGSDAPK